MIKQAAIAIIFTVAITVAAMPQTTVAGSGGGQFFDNSLTDLQVNPAGKRHYYKRYKKKSKKKRRRARSKKKVTTAPSLSAVGISVQKVLQTAGLYYGPLDGKLDSYETRVAIMQYQLNQGLPQTGELSSELKGKLLQEGENAELTGYLHNAGITQHDKAVRLQAALKVQGFYSGTIDGDFGQKSLAAMRLYQQAKGMTPSGVLLPEQEQELVAASIQQIQKQQTQAMLVPKQLDTRQPSVEQTTPAQTQSPPVEIQPVDEQVTAQEAVAVQQPTTRQPQSEQDTKDALDSVDGVLNLPAPVVLKSSQIIENVPEKQVIQIAILTELTELKVEADVFSESMAELPAGKQVTVNSIEGDWAHVSVDGQQGYVYAEYLAPTNKE